MEYFKIEKCIEDTSSPYTGIFQKMMIGDSFALPDTKLTSVSVCASNYGRKHGSRFSVRRQFDGHYRCFRIK